MSSRLLDLPVELQDNIVSNALRPDFLMQICLTCRSLYDIAAPQSYYRIQLNIDSLRSWHSLLQEDHSAHKHIRELIVTTLPVQLWKSTDESTRTDKFRLLNPVLRRARLKLLQMPEAMRLEDDICDLIFTHQKTFKHIQLGPIASLIFPRIAALKGIGSLVMPQTIGSEDLEFYRALLTQGSIRNLAIRSWHYDPGYIINRSTRSSPLADDVNSYGALFTTLFPSASQASYAPVQQFRLERLSLFRQQLGWVDRSIPPYVAFENLHELQIHECHNPGHLLLILAERFRTTGSALKVFSLRKYQKNNDTEPILAVQAFLRSFSGLQYLELRWDTPSDPDFTTSCFSGHFPTLTDLYLSFVNHDPAPSVHNWSLSFGELEVLLLYCPNLRQLRVTLTKMNVSEANVAYYERKSFWSAIDRVLFDRRIEIFRILNWPEAFYDDSIAPYPWQLHHSTYLRKVDAFATKIIQRVTQAGRPSNLKLLCFGDYRQHKQLGIPIFAPDQDEGVTIEGMMAPECACYFRGKQRNRFGFEEDVVIPVPREQVKYEMPFWDAIDLFQEYEDNGLGAADYAVMKRN